MTNLWFIQISFNLILFFFDLIDINLGSKYKLIRIEGKNICFKYINFSIKHNNITIMPINYAN